MLLGALALLTFGVGGMYGIYWMWHLAGLNPNGDAAKMAVATIMPMMGIPYIIFIWSIWQGCQGLCICAYNAWKGHTTP